LNLKNLSRYVGNLPGWRKKRKLLIIESDDWGSIRMPGRKARKSLLQRGIIEPSNRYNRYDTLANTDDLQELFGVLTRHRDGSGNSAVFTAMTITGNPDFDRIRDSEFQTYFYEPFPDTLSRYYGSCESIMKLWQEGMELKIFKPQFHGREHLNVNEWLRMLRLNDSSTRIAFEEGFWGFTLTGNDNARIGSLQAAFDLYDKKDLEFQAESIREGLNIFEELFGYRATFFVPPNGPFNNSLGEIASENGVRFISKAKKQTEPLGEGKVRLVYNKPGKRNKYGQIVLARNCVFEPSEEGVKDWVDSCLNDINIAFRMRKPAVVSTHRVNYIGALEEQNRTRSLGELDRLLAEITKKWPDIEFITSDQLGSIIAES
jgi:hypothetical protein